MRFAVLSGKGGTGKTFVSVNLAAANKRAIYMDCDVEEPNGRLFFNPTGIKETPVTTSLPTFDANKCNGCRKCVDFCHFNALVFLKNTPKLFPDVCHSCGGCKIVCDQGAITESERTVGTVEVGFHKQIITVTGILNTGEASAIPVIKQVLDTGAFYNCGECMIIDCPPGSSCSAMESVSLSNYSIVVVEPTAFGLHNFQMIHELLTLMNKQFGIVINKATEDYPPLIDYCNTHNIKILCQIPYSDELAKLNSAGEIVVAHNPDMKDLFQTLFHQITKEMALCKKS